MTAPTVSVRFLLARAAVRTTGVLHVVSQRDSGALNPVCGANPIRSRTTETWSGPDEGNTDTFRPLMESICPDCQGIAAAVAPSVADGIALFLRADATTELSLSEVPVDAIRVPASHPRTNLGDLESLIASIRAQGVVQPILVRATDTGYEVVAGARRLAAARAAGLATVPAIVADHDPLAALVENLHRQDLNPIELAHAYQQAVTALGVSKAELGRRLGISRSQVSNTIRLLGLPAEEQARIVAGDLTAEGGRALLRRDTPDINRAKVTNRATPAEQLTDLSALLTDVLETRARITMGATTGRIVIDVTDPAELERIVRLLGVRSAAA